MTLRYKFKRTVTTRGCEKIADDHAIDFKKWCDLNKSIIHTDEELLEIFKKEKGL